MTSVTEQRSSVNVDDCDEDLHNSVLNVCPSCYKNRHNINNALDRILALAIYSLIEMACKMLGLGGILGTTDTLILSFISDKTGSKNKMTSPRSCILI